MVLDLKYYLPDSLSVGFILPEQYDKSTDIIIDPTLIYSTYIGGSGDDQLDLGGLVKDDADNIYGVGQTTSSTNFPVSVGAFDISFNGNTDIVVYKLNSSGSALDYATYIGGSSTDIGSNISICKTTNEVVVIGSSESSNFPVTAGAYQTAAAGGWEAIFFKINPTGNSLLVSSYFGGSGYDRGGGIAIDPSLNIYLHGMTTGNLPVTAGAFQGTYGGGTNDSFVAKFNPSGSSLLYVSYLGGYNDDYERAQMLVDNNGNAYVTGKCGLGFPVTSGAWDLTHNGGLYDAYVSKINPTGSALVFSTFLGGSGDDTGYQLFINDDKEVFVVGECTAGFPVTNCSYDPTFNGGVYDGFFCQISADGSHLLYSTYLGGGGSDRANGIIANPDNTVFIAGNTSSSNFPCTTGSFDVSYNGGSNDLFVLKLPIKAFPYQVTADTLLCQGSSVNLVASGGSSYFWSTSSTDSTITVSPTTSTTYYVTISNGSCSEQESISVFVATNVDVYSIDPAICQGESPTITAVGASDYLWSTGSTTASITVSPSNTTTYIVTGSLSGCTSSASVIISVFPQPFVDLGNDTVLCFTGPLVLDAGDGFATYQWQNGSTDPTLAINTSGVYAVTAANTQGCSTTDTIRVTLNYPPELELGPGTFLCDASTVILDGGAGDGSWTYVWQDLSAGQYYPVSTPGTYMLTITNTCGEVSDTIVFAPCPGCIADLPSAFSPNGDGVNDLFHILGEGISDVSFLIYDRHGQKVFETTHPDIGWDGTFKGVLQENEVYYYYLSVTCFNGETIVKKGDVTLIL